MSRAQIKRNGSADAHWKLRTLSRQGGGGGGAIEEGEGGGAEARASESRAGEGWPGMKRAGSRRLRLRGKRQLRVQAPSPPAPAACGSSRRGKACGGGERWIRAAAPAADLLRPKTCDGRIVRERGRLRQCCRPAVPGSQTAAPSPRGGAPGGALHNAPSSVQKRSPAVLASV